MDYTRQYQNRINWQNTPSMSTPLNATNLNKMDVALQYMDGKLKEAVDSGIATPNPSGTATENLTKLGIGDTIYNIAGGGGSYTAGTGINIVNGAIHNTQTGARSGIIDSISSSRAHTQIMLATNETFKAYETLILKSETSGSASTLRVQYASSASSVYDYNLYDTDGTTAKTLSLESGKIIIVMLDQTGYKALVLSEIVSEVPLSIEHGGTGNIYGYIRTGKKAGTNIYDGATIEGYENTNEGAYAHAEGQDNTIGSMAQASHVEGYENTVSGQNGHAEGMRNQASNTNAHAEGYYTIASGEASHAEGGIEIVGTDRYPNTASGKYSHAEGGGNTASGNYSHVEGRRNLASAYTAHAEGASTTANNDSAHAEGEHTLASSTASHAEGSHSTASGVGAHSEGSYYTDFDTGNIVGNTASAEGSHAEGIGTSASGTASHSEGYGTSASGNYSHASGGSTTAGYAYQTVVGKINDNKSSTLFEVGNGTGANARSNAFEVYSDGKISCDNGSSKFQFTQSGGADGYYDASGTFHAFGSGSGNTVSKTRYQISSSSWSSSANSDGYYTLTTTLNPAIGSSPDVYVAGSADGTQPTDTQKTQFSYLKRCKVNGSTLTLYASSKPSSTFYIWVEGVNGTGSGDIVGNVIQPNGAVSGGGEFTNVTTLHVLDQAGAGDEKWNDPSTEANGQYRNYFAYGTAADITKIRASKYIRVNILRKYTSGSLNLFDLWSTTLIDVATLKSIETAQNSRHVRVVLTSPDTFYLYPVGNIFIYPLGTVSQDKLLVQFAENTQLYDIGANYHVYDVIIDCI